jgi:nitroreductase
MFGLPALPVGPQYLERSGLVRPAVDLNLLVLEELVRGEEVLDLSKAMWRDLVETLGVLPEWIGDGDAEHLEVVTLVVAHAKAADRPRPHAAAGERGLGQQDHCVGVVAVVGAGLLHVAVLEVVVNGGGQDAIEAQDARALVELVFVAAALWDLNHDLEDVREGTRCAVRHDAESRLRTMDIERAVGRLRVVRHFSDDAVADEDLNAILEAGRRTGSAKNLQRWHFIAIRDRSRLEALAAMGENASHLAGGAAAIALVTPDPHAEGVPLSVMWDLGRAAQNMTLVAWGRGIGCVPATVYNQALCREILGYPADHHCEYILNFGHPASAETLTRPLRRGGRLPMDDIVHRERW